MNNLEISKKKPFCLLKKMYANLLTVTVLLILTLTTSKSEERVQSSPCDSPA